MRPSAVVLKSQSSDWDGIISRWSPFGASMPKTIEWQFDYGNTSRLRGAAAVHLVAMT